LIKVHTDIGNLVAELRQVTQKAVRGVSDVIREEGEIIAELARDYAPVDQGNLESAIKVREERTGYNRRYEVDVYIDPDVPAPELDAKGNIVKGTEGKTVGDYAMEMHEGDYNLGIGSRQKADALGVKVGPKFLERAVDERRPIAIRKANAKVKDVLK
jgi:hypothetical protein